MCVRWRLTSNQPWRASDVSNIFGERMPDILPPGVTLIADFISADEERELLAHVEAGIPGGRSTRRPTKQRNIVQRWGSDKPYYNDVLSPVIPEHFQFLLDRLVEQNHVDGPPDSVTLNQYLKNQAISAHIDKPDAGKVITVLSLVSPATLVFRLQQKSFSVELPARSLVQMRDDIRYNWTHEILPVTAVRYSLVFRNSREGE